VLVWQWGQSFRNAVCSPSVHKTQLNLCAQYLVLSNLRRDFEDVPLLAMTGSVTNNAMEISIEKLGMRRCVRVSESLDRPNLYYEVKQKHKDRTSLISDIINLTRYDVLFL
jgi:superfamily II DNA helicase RecQ